MKKTLLLCICLISFSLVFSQSGTIETKDSLAIFTKVEVEATFPGGLEAWKHFLQNNLDMEKVVKKAAPKKKSFWSQTANVKFLIDTDGTIIEATVINASVLHAEVIREARRVILLSPKWNPGYQNGRPVKSYRTQPITFAVSVE
jgi:protein TonB